MSIIFSEKIKDAVNEKYDVFFGAIGFETRSRFALESTPNDFITKTVAFAFDERKVFDFDVNYKFFRERATEIFDANPAGIVAGVARAFEDFNETEKVYFIALDISSFSRQLIAVCFDEIITQASSRKITVNMTVLYSPALYSTPSNQPLPVNFVGPVTGRYSGFTVSPELPVVAVVGLGYEHARALGAIEYVDPSEKWFFLPQGSDTMYEHDVLSVNKDLLDYYSIGSNVTPYNVVDPYSLFINLRSLITGLKTDRRVVLLPFGPKIFFFVSLIMSEVLGREIAVWRVSGGQKEEAVDRLPDGQVISFRFEINSEPSCDIWNAKG